MDYLRWELDSQVKFIRLDQITGVEIEPDGNRQIVAGGLIYPYRIMAEDGSEDRRAGVASKTQQEMLDELTAA